MWRRSSMRNRWRRLSPPAYGCGKWPSSDVQSGGASTMNQGAWPKQSGQKHVSTVARRAGRKDTRNSQAVANEHLQSWSKETWCSPPNLVRASFGSFTHSGSALARSYMVSSSARTAATKQCHRLCVATYVNNKLNRANIAHRQCETPHGNQAAGANRIHISVPNDCSRRLLSPALTRRKIVHLPAPVSMVKKPVVLGSCVSFRSSCNGQAPCLTTALTGSSSRVVVVLISVLLVGIILCIDRRSGMQHVLPCIHAWWLYGVFCLCW
jgi:hypothetical protein